AQDRKSGEVQAGPAFPGEDRPVLEVESGLAPELTTLQLFKIAEDRQNDQALRIAAINRLHGKPDVPLERVLQLLTDDACDPITMAVVSLLGSLGDSRALPALRRLEPSSRKNGLARAVVQRAMVSCSER